MASVYPVLISLGVSQLTALSVIAAATLFDQGPGSANTAMAAELIGQSNVEYFITHQLPLVIPTSLVVMVLFYFNNRYFDKRCKETAGWHIAGVKCDCNLISRKTGCSIGFCATPGITFGSSHFLFTFCGTVSAYCNIGYHYCYAFSLFLSLVFVLFHTRSVRTTFNVLQVLERHGKCVYFSCNIDCSFRSFL